MGAALEAAIAVSDSGRSRERRRRRGPPLWLRADESVPPGTGQTVRLRPSRRSYCWASGGRGPLTGAVAAELSRGSGPIRPPASPHEDQLTVGPSPGSRRALAMSSPRPVSRNPSPKRAKAMGHQDALLRE